MCARQMAVISQQINQQGSGLDVKGLRGVVDLESYFHKSTVSRRLKDRMALYGEDVPCILLSHIVVPRGQLASKPLPCTRMPKAQKSKAKRGKKSRHNAKTHIKVDKEI